jgi:F-type H+-transporting ATPase subunit delta
MRSSTTARRYAEAAFSVASQENDTSLWLRDLQAVADALHDPDISNYFKDPKTTREDKLATINRIFGSSHPHVTNLLRLLATQQRMFLLPAIAREFQQLYRESQGITEAKVTVARPVSDDERNEITRRLEAATGKTVEAHIQVDPSIIGGIVVRIGDRLIDASVAGRLQRLRHEMAR